MDSGLESEGEGEINYDVAEINRKSEKCEC